MESVSLKDQLYPNHDNCATCHEVDNDEECSTCHYGDNFEALVKKKSGLIFNHKVHLNQSRMLVVNLVIKGLSEVDYSWQAAGAHPPMETCY